MKDSSSKTSPCPVFVGGTGRSGTTIAGELIGASSAYALVPIELRFHVDKGGLPDLARATASLDQFEARMRNSWYVRPPNKSGPRGVHVILDRPGLDEALARLRSSYALDPWSACGAFLGDVIKPLCHFQGRTSWVEMTPPNAASMDSLARMLPSAKFVHMVRDGRDVASSVVGRSWGPNDLPAALRWWGDQMTAVNRAADRVSPTRVLTMRLESLVGEQRSQAYDQLVRFLDLTGDEAMKSFFEKSVSTQRSHRGRWRGGLSDEETEKAEMLYAEQQARLKAGGHPMPPIL